MPNPLLSQIKLPTGNVYDLKDAQAREDIETLRAAVAGGTKFLGITQTALTDGASGASITIDGESITPSNGDIAFYGTKEFIFSETDNKWHELGSTEDFGDLAFQNSASTTYQPQGTVSQPTFTGASITSTGTFTPTGDITFTTQNQTATVSAASGTATYTPQGQVSAPTISVVTAGTTTTIKNPTAETVAKTVVAAAPGATAPANNIVYYSVANETLSLYQLGYTTGASITTDNVAVKTGDATYEAAAPSFTGTGVRLVTGNISVPASATFAGDTGNISVTGTTDGTVSQPTFTGTSETITVS